MRWSLNTRFRCFYYLILTTFLHPFLFPSVLTDNIFFEAEQIFTVLKYFFKKSLICHWQTHNIDTFFFFKKDTLNLTLSNVIWIQIISWSLWSRLQQLVQRFMVPRVCIPVTFVFSVRLIFLVLSQITLVNYLFIWYHRHVKNVTENGTLVYEIITT